MQIVKTRKRRYQSIFNTPDGQWVFADIEKRFGAEDVSIVKANGDPHLTAYYEGQRAVYRYIADMCRKSMADIEAARLDYVMSNRSINTVKE